MLIEGIHPNKTQLEIARNLPAVHGTTINRLLSIIRDGVLYSHRRLREVHPEIVEDRLNNATDQLDISLGLDNYVFLGVGRVHPADVQPAYLLFPNSIIDEENAVINMREIVHHGALVSPEAIQIAQRTAPNLDPENRNTQASQAFFSESLDSRYFREVFAAFLARWTPTRLEYAFQSSFPNTPIVGGRAAGWEGPQLIIPNEIAVHRSFGILLVDESDDALRRVASSGFPKESIFRMTELLARHKRKGDPVEEYHKKEGQRRYPFINMNLQELAGRELGHQSESLEAALESTQRKIQALLKPQRHHR
jgi:hypothetical protein